MPTMTQNTREDAIRYIRQGGFIPLEDALRRRGLSRETLVEIASEIDFPRYTTTGSIKDAIRNKAVERMQTIDRLEGKNLYPFRLLP